MTDDAQILIARLPHATDGALVSIELAKELEEVWRPLRTIGLRRETREKRVGGKATKLAELLRSGLPVVPGWVLDSKVFARVVDDALPRGHDVASLIKLAGTIAGTDRAARARDRVLQIELPSDIRDAIVELWKAVEPHCPWGLSIRSSATCEDDRASSLAGLATTILGARGPTAIEEALRQVWASLYMPRTLVYLSRWNVRTASMPVLIQRMVVASSAGVMFTAPPSGLESARWQQNERLIHTTFGLGAPIVEGATLSDSLRIDEHGKILDEVIAEKTSMLVVEDKGVSFAPVANDDRDRSSLPTAMKDELARVARELDISGRKELDIEFAIEVRSGSFELAILQGRPITGGLFPDGGDRTTVWSRANVGEALPGAATPLTWSIAKRFSDEGFRAAFEALGCNVPKSSVLVANVYGRFYLNLSTFMEIASEVPGLNPRMILSQSGGVDEKIISILEAQLGDRNHRRFLLRAPRTLPKFLARHLRLSSEVQAFEAATERRVRVLREMDLSILPDDALVQTLRSATKLLSETGELMLTCASASLASHLALTALLSRAAGGDEPQRSQNAGRMARTLTGGISALDSANPGIALLRIAKLAKNEPAARDLLIGAHLTSIETLPDGPTRAALREFLDEFGDRSIREAELATPRWREDPTTVLTMLASALRQETDSAEAGPLRARVSADHEMARIERLLTSIEVRAVRLFVDRTREFTALRERMRAWVTKTLGLIRSIALDIDRRLRRIDSTLSRGSVFFCHYDELIAALASGRAEIGHVVRLRLAEHLRDASRPDPPSSFVGRPPPVTLPPSSAKRLIGLPASSGVVEGRARVLGPGTEGLGELEAGEVLVARTTDVGLSPLFLVAAAIVTELGGPLSHAAIVAREYAVPAVVNVEGATLVIRTGDLLRVDGDRGFVEKIER